MDKDLQNAYTTVRQILGGLDFHSLYPGFHCFDFALYTDEEVCLNGEIFPYNQSFLGNTAISYNGRLTAIWKYDFQITMSRLAYCLVHEMFHCFQREKEETRFPDEMALLSADLPLDWYYIRHKENLLLAEAYRDKNMDALGRFHALRRRRLEMNPAFMKLECRCETIEGMAEYTGLKALRRLSPADYEATASDYLSKLEEESALVLDTRRMAYYTGSLFLLTLDELGIPWQNDFQKSDMVYLQNMNFIQPLSAEAGDYPFLVSLYRQSLEDKKKIVEDMKREGTYTEAPSVICGFDPMNMLRYKDDLFCRSFIQLKTSNQTLFIPGPVLLKLKPGTDYEVEGYIVKN